MLEAYYMAMEDCVALGNSSDEIRSEKLTSKRNLMPIGIDCRDRAGSTAQATIEGLI
jgi:hypothetical protein